MIRQDSDKYRFERKFLINGLYRWEVESIIKQHPAMFKEIFHLRHINNIYFDTIDMAGYFASLDGTSERYKARIRWYGDLFGYIKKPVFELKVKKGWLNKKLAFPLMGFEFEKGCTLDYLFKVLKESPLSKRLALNLKYFRPVLLNRYERKYFQSADRDFRITIDDKMQYYLMKAMNNFFSVHSSDVDHVVLELKYDQDKDAYSDRITNQFPFRMTRNSKFLNGIERLYEI